MIRSNSGSIHDGVSVTLFPSQKKSEEIFISFHSIGFNLLVMAGSVASMPVIKQNIMVMKACDRVCLSHGRLKGQANQSEPGGYTIPQTQCPASFNQASSLTFHYFPIMPSQFVSTEELVYLVGQGL